MRIALLLAGLCGLASAQPTDLLNGVRQIASGYFNGSLIVFGEEAFPVLTVPTGAGAAEPLIAAARFGSARMVVLATTSPLDPTRLSLADTGRLTANLLRWAAGGKPEPRIGIYKISGLAQRLKPLDLDAPDVELADRTRSDVIALYGRLVADSDVISLQQYVRDGGGLVIADVGLFAEQRSPGLDLATQVPANRLIAPAGIVWSRSEITLASQFRVGPTAALSHAGNAVAAFEASESGKRVLSPSEWHQVYATLFRALWDLPHNDTLLLPRLDRILERFQSGAIPSAATPIAADDYAWRLAIVRATQQLRWTAPEDVRAHPAAAEFPGPVPASAQRVDATIRIETSQGKWGWFGTGLYAAPGEVISIHAPASVLNQGLALRIGAHTDILWDLEEWSRMPNITLQKPIASPETRAASAFGGSIYIVVPQGTKAGDFDITISNAVRAPHYVHGKTSLGEWRTSIRDLPAPWAEIESGKIILTVPSRFVRTLDDPAALMDIWDRISDLESELAAIPPSRTRAERLLPDVQIAYGIQHAGYPVMMYLTKAHTLLSTRDLLSGSAEEGLHNRSMWGLPHELGHQVQSSLWSFEGALEPTANLFALYVMEKLCHIPVASNRMGSPEFRAAELARYNEAKRSFDVWKQDRWIATAYYVQLQQAFGWEAFRNVFAEYAALPIDQQPKSDAEKRDQWLIRFSRQVHRNLGPFFQAWAIPTSESARKSISDLPAWMPEELK